MKFMEKAKRFFTLSAQHEGFTLVELIVVIAILAILAGVAIPAYSGYINKANEAADQTLLSAVNKAFASAALENGKDSILMADGSVVVGLAAEGDGFKVASVKPYNDDFFFYYTGNENATFKTITGLYFKGGVFVEGVGASYTLADGTVVNIAVNKSHVDAMNNSVFMDEDAGLGISGLMNKLGDITDFAGKVFGDGGATSGALEYLAQDEDFLKSFAGYMGIEGADTMTSAQLEQAIGALGEVYSREEQQSMMSNALVLYAAQNSTLDKQSATALLTGDNAAASIRETLATDPGKAMAEASLAYGMFTAYAHSLDDSDPNKAEMMAIANNKDNPLGVMNALDDPGFKDYVANQGQSDMDGYLAAMNMINDGTQDNGVALDILTNGFADNAQLEALMNSAMGIN